MPPQHELARLVKQRCEEIGLTPQRLADLSGARFHTVQQLLDGKGGQAIQEWKEAEAAVRDALARLDEAWSRYERREAPLRTQNTWRRCRDYG